MYSFLIGRHVFIFNLSLHRPNFPYTFERLEWLSVPKRLMYNKAVLTYKALNNLAPAYISGLLKPVSETHTRSLRSSENGLLSVPRSRTALYDRSF